MAEKADGRQRGGEDLPEGFTIGLALLDGVPVVLFCLSAILFGSRLGSPLFVCGAVLAFLGGAGKVCWKLLIAVARRNIPALSRQMRVLMPAGFILMLAGACTRIGALLPALSALVRMPAAAFLLGWLACMIVMGHLGRSRARDDAWSNWIEECVNSVGQAALLAAIILAG